MYRYQTIRLNMTGTDVEDTPPDNLTAWLCINRSDGSWFNTSIGHDSADFYELDFQIPLGDDWLGPTNFYLRLNDTDSGEDFKSLVNITIINNPPVISNELENASIIMYRSQTIRINLTGIDVEDNPPNNLTAWLCINRSDSSWSNNSINYLSGDFYELDFQIPLGDVWLGPTNFYLRLNDTDNGEDFKSLVNITILNNNPDVNYQSNNISANIYRSEVIQVNISTVDVEDLELTVLFCLNLSNGSWDNQTMINWTLNNFSIYYTIPLMDIYLGFVHLYVQVNDSDYGITLISLYNFTILNNDPEIISTLTNYSQPIYLNDTLWVNSTVTDIEDLPPDGLTVFLCWHLESNSWYNVSMSNLTQSFFEINFTIPNNQIFIGYHHLYIRANDSDYGKDLADLGFINITYRLTGIIQYLNNTEINNETLDFNDTIWIKIYYYRLSDNSPLPSANAYITCNSHPSVVDGEEMTNLLNGNYSWYFNPNSSGDYLFSVNISHLGFLLQEVQFEVSVRGATELISYLNGTERINIDSYFDQCINITVLYNDTSNDKPINGSIVNIEIESTLYNMTEIGDSGYYYIV
jgi:hypothetical protein